MPRCIDCSKPGIVHVVVGGTHVKDGDYTGVSLCRAHITDYLCSWGTYILEDFDRQQEREAIE